MAILTKITSGTSTVKTNVTTPFIATVLGTANPTLDYKKIQAAKICGMMFYAGELFDVSHSKKQVYRNPNLANQVQRCQSAGLPYALYVNVRARTEIEADEECRTLYYVISEFSPQFGLWLSLQTTANKAMTDKILEIYYKYINSWGLKDRCGLYITKKQITDITWNNFKDRYYLWCIDSLDITKVDTEIFEPSMFEVPD